MPTDKHYAQARLLIMEYARRLGSDLEFQGFSKELADLARKYGQPSGAMLLRHEDSFVGCVGLRHLPDGTLFRSSYATLDTIARHNLQR